MDTAEAPLNALDPTLSDAPEPAAASAPAPAPAPGDTAPLRVALIIGSNRDGRFGPVIADWVLSRAALRTGMRATTVDVVEVSLPQALTRNPAPDLAGALAATSATLAAADAFVVLTPEYNHSYPAPLKNLIDWHFVEWQAKPVGFVSYGGVSGGLRAVEHLRAVFAELHAVTVRESVSFPYAGELFGPDGSPRDPARAEGALDALFDQLDWWGQALREARRHHPYGT